MRVAFPALYPSAGYAHATPVFVIANDGHLYSWDIEALWQDRGGSQLAGPPQVMETSNSILTYVVDGNGTLEANVLARDGSFAWRSPGGCGIRPFVSAGLP